MPTTSERVRFESVSKRFQLRDGQTLKEAVGALVRSKPPPFQALKALSFSLEQGETLGIIGPNGSGKSTILRLIAHVMKPTSGKVYTRGRISPLLDLRAAFHPDLTGRENIHLNASILGISDRDARSRVDDIIEFAEIRQFLDTPIKRFSSGMSLRLAFSVAVHSEPDILLVDEILAVGDASFQEKCLERIRELQAHGVSIVLVSHQLDQVRAFCDRTLLLAKGELIDEGPTAGVIERYEAVYG